MGGLWAVPGYNCALCSHYYAIGCREVQSDAVVAVATCWYAQNLAGLAAAFPLPRGRGDWHHDGVDYLLAQVNIGRMREPLDSPLLAEFVAALDPVNAAADTAPGFVWRLQTEDGNATAVHAFEWDRAGSAGGLGVGRGARRVRLLRQAPAGPAAPTPVVRADGGGSRRTVVDTARSCPDDG